MIGAYFSLVRDEWRPLAFGVACAFLSSPGQTFFIAQFAGAFAADLGLGAAQVGSLYMIGTIGAAVLLPLTGHWIDRVDLRLYTVLVMAGLAVACGVMAVAAGPASLVAALLLLRLTGQGLTTHTVATSIARYFRRRRGQALSLVAMGFPLAQAILPSVVVMAGGTAAWRASYAVTGLAVLLIAAPALVWLIAAVPRFSRPVELGSGSAPSSALAGLAIVTRSRFFWLALPILLYMPFVSTALVFHIQAIAGAKGWPAELVALGFTGYGAGYVAALLFLGPLIDRFGARAVLPLMNLPLFLGVTVLGLSNAQAALPVFLALMGMSSGLSQTAVAAVWVEVYGAARLGMIRSVAAMLMVGGTALGPFVVGFLMESGLSLRAMCGGLVGAGIAAALLAALGGRQTRPETDGHD